MDITAKETSIPVAHRHEGTVTEIHVSWSGYDSRRKVARTSAARSRMLASPNLRCSSQVAKEQDTPKPAPSSWPSGHSQGDQTV